MVKNIHVQIKNLVLLPIFYQPTRFDLCCFDRDAQMLIKAVARCGRHYGVKLREGVANINVCKRKRQNWNIRKKSKAILLTLFYANAKPNSEAELFLFENYSYLSSTLSFKSNRTYSKK